MSGNFRASFGPASFGGGLAEADILLRVSQGQQTT